jgi:hypothetical protein
VPARNRSGTAALYITTSGIDASPALSPTHTPYTAYTTLKAPNPAALIVAATKALSAKFEALERT